MGILAFLTASRYKAELTRQRDEIARLHQLLDVETGGRQEAEQRLDGALRGSQAATEECQQLREKLKNREKTLHDERTRLREQADAERQRLQEQTSKQIHEAEARAEKARSEAEEKARKARHDAERRLREAESELTTLRQRLEEKQRREAEVQEQLSAQVRAARELEARAGKLASTSQAEADRAAGLETQSQALERDLAATRAECERRLAEAAVTAARQAEQIRSLEQGLALATQVRQAEESRAAALESQVRTLEDGIARTTEEYRARTAAAEADTVVQARRAAALEARVEQLTEQVQSEQVRAAALENDKKALQADLGRIMGNLNRW